MTHVVGDGLGLIQATGQKVRDGAGAVAHGIKDGIDGIRPGEHPGARKRKPPVWKNPMVEMAASVAGAVAAFFVSKLVRRTMLRRHGK